VTNSRERISRDNLVVVVLSLTHSWGLLFFFGWSFTHKSFLVFIEHGEIYAHSGFPFFIVYTTHSSFVQVFIIKAKAHTTNSLFFSPKKKRRTDEFEIPFFYHAIKTGKRKNSNDW
jgi:hypothetical protein